MKKLFLLLTAFISLSALAQSAGDTTDGRFHDDLLNHLVGNWSVSGMGHGEPFKNLTLKAEWILNHQYLQIHEKGTDTIPWLKLPWEAVFLIGYNPANKRYVVYELTIRGVDTPYEGFSYASRSGNELKIASKTSPDEFINQRFIWDPVSGSWRIESRLQKMGKEGELYLDLKAISLK